MELEIIKQRVKGKSRKLKARWPLTEKQVDKKYDKAREAYDRAMRGI